MGFMLLVLLFVAVQGVADAGTLRVSVSGVGTGGNANSTEPAISSNGNVVAFASDSTDLGVIDNNNSTDVYVHTLTPPSTVRASVDGGGNEQSGSSEEPALSRNGSVVAFQSDAQLTTVLV